jgi:mannose-6-phosphate isomerase-like protein (cupin superfamily)
MFDETKKAWGVSRRIVSKDNVEVHHITILPGGHCSWHHHERKVNVFAVLEGRLSVQWSSAPDFDPLTDRCGTLVLYEGDSTEVRAGQIHRFINVSGAPVVALEVYYPEVLREDIVRHTTGGIQ